ncbi:MAG: MobF family relaxase [Acidimicrobiales bacterium]
MAWFRRMGADSVDYHRQTVVGREDDHPGRALAYYGSRGETPLRWGGALAVRLGLEGEVTPEAYEAAFGPGGFRDPVTGERLVNTKRPGFELVFSVHKSVATLGLIDRADDMHAILDTTTQAALGYMDPWMQERGGRRGVAARRTPTTGLAYALTRHATSREGDPHPHDHALITNLTEMRDSKGGWKALDSAALREIFEAATYVGHLYGAAKAIELGYGIAPDGGKNGRGRHWRLAGCAEKVYRNFSKRADQIGDFMEERGYKSNRAERVAARATRKHKRHTGPDELMPHWHAQMREIGVTPEEHAAAIDAAGWPGGLLPDMTDDEIDTLAERVLAADGEFMKRHKVFGRFRLVAEVAPALYGRDPAQLDYALDRILRSKLVVPLVGIEGAYEQAYATAEVLATEQGIARRVERMIDQPGAAVDTETVDAAMDAKEAEIGRTLTTGQRRTVEAVCRSGRAVDVIVGVAGAGKTTAIDAVASALEDAGYTVHGTSTSGQAARTLSDAAGIEARTLRSLLWRLDHGQITLSQRSVVVLDEAGMTTDADLLRLVTGVERAGAKLVIIGDHRQVSAVGPGGALDAMLERHPEILTVLDENVRQHDPAERRALAELRGGSVERAVDWYARNHRTQIAATRTEALAEMVDAWATDTQAGHRTALLAWRREDVRDLNRLARARADELGWLTGDDLEAPGGRRYTVGDRVVLLAPNNPKDLRTSEQAMVAAVDHHRQTLTLRLEDARLVTLTGEEIDANHVDHGYALTVHRAQGATYDRVHGFADGGGRELGYVEMSRAGDRTTLHAVADDLDQAIEDVTVDWSTERRQRWVTRTAAPGRDTSIQPAPVDVEAQRTALVAELKALTSDAPPDVTDELTTVQKRLLALHENRRRLLDGTGRWRHTPAGHAARRLVQARAARQHAQVEASRSDLTRRERRRWRQEAQQLAIDEAAAQAQWGKTGEPIARRLDSDIADAETRLEGLRRHAQRRHLWLTTHQDRARRIQAVERALRRLDEPAPADMPNQPRGIDQPAGRRPPEQGDGLSL